MGRARFVVIGAVCIACGAPRARPAAADAEEPEPAHAPARPSARRDFDTRHFPSSCDDPKHPCSEVGTWNDGELPSPEEVERLFRDRSTPHHGTLDGLAVGAALEKERARFRACGLVGTAVVRVIVSSVGVVQAATIERDHLSAGDKECLVRAVKETRFPMPGEDAEVLVPFVFRAATAKDSAP